jgi:regulator of protease activity HflC (stomatin/prohibitin superfamily)
MKEQLKSIYRAFRKTVRKKTLPVLLLLCLLLLLAFYFWPRIFITVLPGEAAVKWLRFAGGTQTNQVYSEGMHYIFPWDKMYIYNVRVQQTAHDFDVLTVNGLRVHLSISIRYRPEYDVLGLLHKEVGVDYVNKLVIPEIESVLRIIIGQITADEVYATKTPVIEKAVSDGIEQVAQRYVKIDDVIIKKVQLPATVAEAIQYKMQQKHLAEAYEFKLLRERKEAERKRIEAGGIRDYNDIIDMSLSETILHWKGILATLDLAASNNAKVVVIGNSETGLPIIGNVPMDATMVPPAETDITEESAPFNEPEDTSENERFNPELATPDSIDEPFEEIPMPAETEISTME